MSLRCLLFSSNEEMVGPILQVLTGLGIDAEYCRSAIEAVERVATLVFQIVITDWEDQPEAASVLKTVRDLKAAHRPLALAVVSSEAALSEALGAGANSVLRKPIKVDQVRDTMRTACELLRAKQPSPQAKVPARPVKVLEPARQAADIRTATAAAPARAPLAVPGTSEKTLSEKTFRTGEFLQSSTPKPGAQFDTESDEERPLEQPTIAPVETLNELEPTAAPVEDAALRTSKISKPVTDWAALQSRRMAPPTPAPVAASGQNELLSYGNTPSYGAQPAAPAHDNQFAAKQAHSEALSDTSLSRDFSAESREEARPSVQTKSNRPKIYFWTAFAVIGLVAAVLPQARQRLGAAYRDAERAAVNWLNPRPVPVPQTVTQHDSFGQAGDEYKLPAVPNIPDATTDPSQIQVVPVIDPTAKQPKGSDTATPSASSDSPSTDPSQNGSNGNGQGQPVQSPAPDDSATVGNPTAPIPPHDQNSSATPQQAVLPISSDASQKRSPAPHQGSQATVANIPSSLRSQTASMTPDAGGAKPVDAGMSSIEPVGLSEAIVRGLLEQPVDPVYPDAAKAGGQRGSVVLQVLVGRDGNVQDAKFTQGSFVFARAAIDAVKQWRFRPYILNGRPVAVQSSITLNFRPPS